MPLDLNPVIGTPSEFTIPETQETLLLQQRALIEGRRAVQMFPNGTDELPLPEGCKRIVTDRGAFHYSPEAITWHRIAQASRQGRENEILGLGPYSKTDVIDTGEPMVCVVERAPNGDEVLAAVTIARWAGAVIVEMKTHAGPGHSVMLETPETVIRDRLAARSN